VGEGDGAFFSLWAERALVPRLRMLRRSLMSLRLSPEAAEYMDDQPASVLSAAVYSHVYTEGGGMSSMGPGGIGTGRHVQGLSVRFICSAQGTGEV